MWRQYAASDSFYLWTSAHHSFLRLPGLSFRVKGLSSFVQTLISLFHSISFRLILGVNYRRLSRARPCVGVGVGCSYSFMEDSFSSRVFAGALYYAGQVIRHVLERVDRMTRTLSTFLSVAPYALCYLMCVLNLLSVPQGTC